MLYELYIFSWKLTNHLWIKTGKKAFEDGKDKPETEAIKAVQNFVSKELHVMVKLAETKGPTKEFVAFIHWACCDLKTNPAAIDLKKVAKTPKSPLRKNEGPWYTEAAAMRMSTVDWD